MINIWAFKDASRIRVTDTNGRVFVGALITIDDASEYEDNTEDMLSIQTDDGRAIGFAQSEVVEIQQIN